MTGFAAQAYKAWDIAGLTDNLSLLLFWVYILSLLVLAIFGAHRLWLLYLIFVTRNKKLPERSVTAFPVVTVQLPVYNEGEHILKLIDCVEAFDWPKDKLEIQVLDDSTDESTEIIERYVNKKRESGLNITMIHRTNRSGFKAGAMENALRVAAGEFVAVFDVDYRPQTDFLKRMMGHFDDSNVAAVQAQIGYYNKHHSILTVVQSILLDGHYCIEQVARNRSGRFITFNGTCGIWRISAISEAGGWQSDTLTEDLDLSIRVQQLGRTIVYNDNVIVEGELPTTLAAFKSQQHRWTKGGVQTMKKMLIPVLKSDIPFKSKVELVFQIGGHLSYLMGFVACLLALPASITRWINFNYFPTYFDLSLFPFLFLAYALFYVFAAYFGKNGWKTLLYLPAVYAIGATVFVSNIFAIVEGFASEVGEFVRTPKGAAQEAANSGFWTKNFQVACLELMMCGYLFLCVFSAPIMNQIMLVPFLAIFFAGFGWVSASSLIGSRKVI